MCFRYIYCVIWIITLIIMYKKLSRSYGLGAIIAIAYIGLFSPLDYMTLSYTSVSLICVLLMATMAYSDEILTRKKSVQKGIIIGVLTTVCTLCYPYFAGFYVIYNFIAIICIAKNMLTGSDLQKEKAKSLLYFSLTMLGVCALCAASYLIWILANASPEQILVNIQMIFTDPQHQSKGIIAGIADLVKRELQVGKIFYGGIGLLSVIALLLGKKRKQFRIVILGVAFLLWGYCQLPILAKPYEYLNIHMKGIAVVGILFIVLLEKRPWKLFICFYSFSIMYIIVGYLNSNTAVTVVAMCMSVAGVAAMLMVVNLAAELRNQYKECNVEKCCAALIISAFAVCQIALELNIRFRYTYYDDTLSKLTEEISVGSAKGLMTVPEKAEQHEELYNTFMLHMPNEENGENTLLIYGTDPWLYLETDMKYDTMSSWLLGDSQIYKRLEKYYDINQKELPEYIFVEYVPEIIPDEYEATELNNTAMLTRVLY